jgi:hypothetical protein
MTTLPAIWKQWRLPDGAHRPRRWAVEHEGIQYPTKLLISRANIWANGAPWLSRLFSGGRNGHRFLSDRGFSMALLDRCRLA